MITVITQTRTLRQDDEDDREVVEKFQIHSIYTVLRIYRKAAEACFLTNVNHEKVNKKYEKRIV